MTPEERAEEAARCGHWRCNVSACPACIAVAIRAAVEEEREACAKVVADTVQALERAIGNNAMSNAPTHGLESMLDIAKDIFTAIRRRK